MENSGVLAYEMLTFYTPYIFHASSITYSIHENYMKSFS